MKIVISIMGITLGFLQYQIWFGNGGVLKIKEIQQAIKKQQKINEGMEQVNNALAAQVNDLKSGSEAIEEQARNELGMIKPGEIFYQLV